MTMSKAAPSTLSILLLTKAAVCRVLIEESDKARRRGDSHLHMWLEEAVEKADEEYQAVRGEMTDDWDE